MDASLQHTVERHKALGHPVRLRIVAMLSAGELCACQITAVLKLAASTVSAHLAELRRAGIVLERKESRWVFFRHHDDPRVLALITNVLASVKGDPRIEADLRIVKHLRRVDVETLCQVGLDLARVGIREPAVPGDSLAVYGRPAVTRGPVEKS